MLFSKKWLRNHPQFLLYFLIHIDILMLCRKFELIPTSNFRVMAILKNDPIFEKSNAYYLLILRIICLNGISQYKVHLVLIMREDVIMDASYYHQNIQ